MKYRMILSVVLLFSASMFGGSCGNEFGTIFDLDGKVERVSPGGDSILLTSGEHLLMPVMEGDRLVTGPDGMILLVACEDGTGWEMGPKSQGEIKGGKLQVKGKIVKREGLEAMAPSGESGMPGGIVMRGDECVQALSPRQANVLEPDVELKWKTTCDTCSPYHILLMSEKEILFSLEVEETSIVVPEGILKRGGSYRWVVDGNGFTCNLDGSRFRIAKKREAKKIRQEIEKRKPAAKDLPGKLAYLAFLLENDLTTEAGSEIDALLELYENNPRLKELKERI